jgi:putative spermidine/putrescine transport system permease protein
MTTHAHDGVTDAPARWSAGGEANGRRIQTVRWDRFLWPAVAISFALLALPQVGFVWLSFHEDLGLGQVGDSFTLANYVRVFSDPFYLHSIWLTIYLSAAAVVVVTVLGVPTAYALARMPAGIAAVLLGLILATSLITVVIKLMGLNLILGTNGFVNQLLLASGLVSRPLHFINNELGVLIGLVQYTLPIFVMLLFGVIQTIPLKLEEAAEIHGATRFSIYRRIILPLSERGLVAAALISFNMSMGAFTSAVLLGGGRVRTLPVLIQQKIIQGTEYGQGAALSTVLVVLVFLINVAAGWWAVRRTRRR